MSLETMQIKVETLVSAACAASGSFNVPIEYENVRFDPEGEAYISVHVMDGRSIQTEIKLSAVTRHPGIVQIDCMVPEDTGNKYLNQLSDFVGKILDRQQFTLTDQAVVTFRTPYAKYLGKYEGWCRTVVTIDYHRDEKPSLPGE